MTLTAIFRYHGSPKAAPTGIAPRSSIIGSIEMKKTPSALFKSGAVKSEVCINLLKSSANFIIFNFFLSFFLFFLFYLFLLLLFLYLLNFTNLLNILFFTIILNFHIYKIKIIIYYSYIFSNFSKNIFWINGYSPIPISSVSTL